MPLTTLHVTNAWHATSGGIRTFYSALLSESARHQRRVIVIAPSERAASEPVGRFGRIYFVPASPAPAFDRRYRIIYPYQYLPGPAQRVLDIIRTEQPDVVEISDKYSLPYLAGVLRKGWARGIARPALVGLSCERFDDNMAAYLARGPVARRFTRWYIRNIYGPPFDAHVANSDYTAAELRAAMPDRPGDFVRVCAPGVDVSDFAPSRGSRAARAQLLRLCRGDAATTLLLYAGRLSPEKNLELLVDTLRRLVETSGDACDYRLVVAGDGPRASWLRAQASGPLADRILMLGNLDRDALGACYASCDVFVHPNPREPFGIGPLEAMASGIPVVVPRSGGVLTYANDTNAWVAEATVDGFASAVAAATRKDRVRCALARQTAQSFRWESAAQRYFTTYDDIHRSVFGRGNRDASTATPGISVATAPAAGS